LGSLSGRVLSNLQGSLLENDLLVFL